MPWPFLFLRVAATNQVNLQKCSLLQGIDGKVQIMGPNFAQVTMMATSVARGGVVKNIANVYNFYRAATILPRIKSEVDTAFQAAIAVPVRAFVSVDYTQVQNTVRWIDDATDSPATFAHAGVGAIAGEREDNFTAAYILMRTGARRARGSKHYGPIAEDSVNGDVLENADYVRLQTIAAAILAGFTDASGNVWQSIVLNTKGGIFDVNPTLFGHSIVIQSVARKSTGSMTRRRVRGVY
jgi:hypothetical protein